MIKTKRSLATAYNIMAYLSMDDHTYTHLSARAQNTDFYYIAPFGLRFNEVTENNLLKVSFSGAITEGKEYHYNKTAHFMHGCLYASRPDISAIFHYHTPYSVAVSAMECGLLPISQWALHFYKKVSYHNYNSLILNDDRSNSLVNDLGKNYVMFLRNHGVVTCGKTIHEAMFYTYHLEQACKAQCLVCSTGQKLVVPSAQMRKQAQVDLLSFEEDLGKRDWESWVRLMENNGLAKDNTNIT